jgi:hypothetical protein
MKSRFPPDVAITVLLPLAIAATGVVVASFIYHATQWGQGATIAAVAIVGLAFLSCLLLSFRSRARRKDAALKSTHDEATPHI